MLQSSRFYSNRFEILAEKMGQNLFGPHAHPFQKRIVIVPSLAMKEDLVSFFATHPAYGIFAGVSILPLAEGFSEILALLHSEKQVRIPSQLELSLRIEQLIYQALSHQDEAEEILRPLLHYVEKGTEALEKRVGALAAHLSALFARWGLYGESFLQEWMRKPGWQQWLWRKIYSEKTGWSYPVQALKMELLGSFQPHLFGFSAMPKVHLDFFHRLHSAFYLLSPCALFWEDAVTDRERIGKRRFFEKKKIKQGDIDAWEAYVRDTHPLLANWGKVGRDFLKLLEGENCLSDEQYEDPGEDSLLKLVQSSFLHLQRNCGINISDHSIEIHSASSLLREVQILYDQLCQIFMQHHIEPKEVLVLAPDLNLYAPFIQTVFGAKDSVFAYSLEAVADPCTKELLDGILHLLSIPALGFSAEAVLELFSFSSFRKKQQISLDDVALIRRWVRDNVRLDSWEEGLDKLLLGLIMQVDEESFLEMQESLWPSSGLNLSDLDLFSKLIQLIHSLRKDVELTTHKRSFSEWVDLLNQIIARYFEADEEQEALLSELLKLRSVICFDEDPPLALATMTRTLQSLTDTKSARSSCHNAQKVTFRPFKNGNITRAKVIWLMGMDETSFPRSEFLSSLCAMKGHKESEAIPQRIDEDRYLFLQSLVVAKEQLIFSYQRVDPQDNKEKAPSSLICELIQYASALPTFHHSALAFDSCYFSNDSLLRSISSRQFRNAQAFYTAVGLKVGFGPKRKLPRLNDRKPVNISNIDQLAIVRPRGFGSVQISAFKPTAVYFTKSLPAQFIDNSCEKAPCEQQKVVDIQALISLAKNPIRFHFQQTLQMVLRSEEDQNGDFLPSPLLRSCLRKKILKGSLKAYLNAWRAQGKLPVGVFGEAAIDAMQEEMGEIKNHLATFQVQPEQIFSVTFSPVCTEPTLQKEGRWILPALMIPMTDGSCVHLTGMLDDLTPQGLLFHGEDKLCDWVKLWPQLLLLSCLGNVPFAYKSQVLLTKSGDIREGKFSDAMTLLQDYLTYYEQALKNFSPLVPDWVASVLAGSASELEKAIVQSVENAPFEDPYLQWLKRRGALPNPQEAIAQWTHVAQHIFRPLVGLWSDHAEL